MGRCSMFPLDELPESFDWRIGNGLHIPMGLGAAQDGDDGNEHP